MREQLIEGPPIFLKDGTPMTEKEANYYDLLKTDDEKSKFRNDIIDGRPMNIKDIEETMRNYYKN